MPHSNVEIKPPFPHSKYSSIHEQLQIENQIAIQDNRLVEFRRKWGVFFVFVLNRDPCYKRDSSSHFRQHLISILIKSCSARGRSDLFPKELQNKTTKPN